MKKSFHTFALLNCMTAEQVTQYFNACMNPWPLYLLNSGWILREVEAVGNNLIHGTKISVAYKTSMTFHRLPVGTDGTELPLGTCQDGTLDCATFTQQIIIRQNSSPSP